MEQEPEKKNWHSGGKRREEKKNLLKTDTFSLFN